MLAKGGDRDILTNTPKNVEHCRILRKTTQEVRHGQEPDCRQENRLSPKDIRQSSVEHLERSIGQQRRRARPRNGIRGIKVLCDCGQRDADSILVDEGDE